MKTLTEILIEEEKEVAQHLTTYYRSLGYEYVEVMPVKKGRPGFYDVYLSNTSPVHFIRLNLNIASEEYDQRISQQE